MYVTSVERLIAALKTRLDVPVATKVPMKPPDLFVRLDPSSPKATSPVAEDTLIAVQVYGQDQEKVINLIGAIRLLLMDEVFTQDPKIVWWQEETGPHDFPDPDNADVYRWQMTGVLTTTLT